LSEINNSHTYLEITLVVRASEAAEGCLTSVAAKLVKIAIKIPFHIHVSENKSAAANLGHFSAISYALKN
jgi:hypothetical protein